MKFYPLTFLFTLLLFISCDVSMLSTEELNEMSNIFVSVKIDDNGEKPELNNVIVKLTDGKKQIINEDIKILVNKKPLQFVVRNELYYTKTSFYYMDSLLRSEAYYFEIVLPDSSIHPLAFIAPKDISLCSFEQVESTSNQNDLKIEWRNFVLPSELIIWKGVHERNSNVHSGGQYAESTIHYNIETETGEYIVPKSFFEDSIGLATYIKAKLIHTENGLTNPELRPQSYIQYQFKKEAVIDIEELQ